MSMRSKFWLGHPVQKKYLTMLILAMFVPTLIIACAEFFIMMQVISKNVFLPDGVAMLAKEAIKPAFMYSSILFVVVCVFILLIGVFSSHRIAGPIYQLEQKVKKIAAGDLSLRIRFREKDELHELARGINKVLDRFEESILRKKDKAEILEGIAGKLHTSLNSSEDINKDDVRDLLDKIRALTQETREELDTFKHFDVKDYEIPEKNS